MSRQYTAAFALVLCGLAAARQHSPRGFSPPVVSDTVNAQLMKSDLLVVTAHPDDESMMAAVMARYADEGRVVSLVVCTHGEGGGNSTGKESGPALGAVREVELRRCLSRLGTRHLYFLNQPDWAYTESVQATLDKWGHDETLRRLVRLVRLLRPTVIATMDPAPRGGQHGHHQAAGRLATEAFEAAANPRAFPEQPLDEGLQPWAASKLYWTGGGPNSRTSVAIDGEARGPLAAAEPGRRYADIARAAESSHRSQGFDKYFESGTQPSAPTPPSRFILVKSRVGSVMEEETDLFAGTGSGFGPPLSPDPSTRAHASPTGVAVEIEPVPAVRRYRNWLRANGLDRLLTRLPAHVGVTMGVASPVAAEITNHDSRRRNQRVTLGLPAGWRSEPASISVDVPANGSARVEFLVTAPAKARVGAYDLVARLAESSREDAGKLDLLPRMTVQRLSRLPAVDADARKWIAAGVAPQLIPFTNVAQGRVAGPAEVSGRFFVAYDRAALQVLVDVTDDTVVSNIAPDDIKAHWRSTSTEICIDPLPRSEHTLGSLKLGIFPADTTGHVRAARDADANPGPTHRKEPSIRLASRMTPTGYVVETRIPWSSLGTTAGFTATPGRRLGFNVILYHAGKRQARVGEDINKSRLAWSPWPGVWGRPENWGLATLE